MSGISILLDTNVVIAFLAGHSWATEFIAATAIVCDCPLATSDEQFASVPSEQLVVVNPRYGDK